MPVCPFPALWLFDIGVFDMAVEKVLVVLELPEPMLPEAAAAWESVNRPPEMLWLEKLVPVGPLPALLWESQYVKLARVAADLCT